MEKKYSIAFIKDNVTVIFGHILMYLIGFFLMPLLIKNIGITFYGGYTLLNSMLGIIFGISSLGAGFYYKRFLPSSLKMEEKAKLFYPQFYFHVCSILILSFVYLLSYDSINKYLFRDEIQYSFYIVPIYLISYTLYAQGGDYFRYTNRVGVTMFGVIALPYLHLLILILFIYYPNFKLNIDNIILLFAICALTIAFYYFYKLITEIKFHMKFYKPYELYKDIRKGFPLVINNVIDFVLAASDQYVISFFISVTAVGYYSPAYKVGSLLILVPKAMGMALPQLLSRAIDGNEYKDAYMMSDYSVKLYILIAVPFISGGYTLSKPILSLLSNPEIAELSYSIVPLISIGMLFYGLTIILFNILFVQLKTISIFKINLFAALFNLFCNILLIYIFKSIFIAAITTLLSYCIAFIYCLNIINKIKWRINIELEFILKITLASILMGFAITIIDNLFLNYNNIIRLFISIPSGLFLYTFLLYFFKVFTKKEICKFKRLIR